MAQSLGLIVLGILLFYSYLAYQTRALTVQVGQMSRLYAHAKDQLDALANNARARKPSRPLLDRIAQAEQSLQAQQTILSLLQHGELGNRSGFSPYFTALSRQTVSGVWLTGFSVSGLANQLSLSGRALRPELVAQLIRQLGNEPIFAGIHFTTLDLRRPAIDDKGGKAADGKAGDGTAAYIEFTLAKTVAATVPPK